MKGAGVMAESQANGYILHHVRTAALECVAGDCVFSFVQVFEGVYNNARMLHFLTAVVVNFP